MDDCLDQGRWRLCQRLQHRHSFVLGSRQFQIKVTDADIMDPIALTVLLIIADARDEWVFAKSSVKSGKQNSKFMSLLRSPAHFKQARDKSFDIFLADLAVSDCDGVRGLAETHHRCQRS